MNPFDIDDLLNFSFRTRLENFFHYPVQTRLKLLEDLFLAWYQSMHELVSIVYSEQEILYVSFLKENKQASVYREYIYATFSGNPEDLVKYRAMITQSGDKILKHKSLYQFTQIIVPDKTYQSLPSGENINLLTLDDLLGFYDAILERKNEVERFVRLVINHGIIDLSEGLIELPNIAETRDLSILMDRIFLSYHLSAKTNNSFLIYNQVLADLFADKSIAFDNLVTALLQNRNNVLDRQT